MFTKTFLLWYNKINPREKKEGLAVDGCDYMKTYWARKNYMRKKEKENRIFPSVLQSLCGLASIAEAEEYFKKNK